MSDSSKGYLCQADDGTWFLCQSPNVKSCCVRKQGDAIRLEGDFSSYPTKKPVEFINGQIISKEGFPYCTLTAALLGIVILLLTYLKKKRKKPLPPL